MLGHAPSPPRQRVYDHRLYQLVRETGYFAVSGTRTFRARISSRLTTGQRYQRASG